jgi:metal-responsive CopG/Arc/MetJ family transcriptional regulator
MHQHLATAQNRRARYALDVILSKSVILPEQLLVEIEEFVKENRDLGYVTKEDFLRDAARQKLQDLKDKAKEHGIEK